MRNANPDGVDKCLTQTQPTVDLLRESRETIYARGLLDLLV